MLNFNKNLLIIFLIFVLSIILGCSQKLTPLNKTDKIIAFGDSLTYGYGSTEGNSYPKILSKITGYNVVNEGLNGDTAQNGKVRLKETVQKENPAAVILSLGGNDMLRKNNQNLKEDLIEMIEYLKSNNIQVILLAEPSPNVLGMTIGLKDADVYQEVAKKEKVLLLDNIYSKYLSDSSLKSDLIHLNDKGYNKVAEDIAKRLKNSHLIDF